MKKTRSTGRTIYVGDQEHKSEPKSPEGRRLSDEFASGRIGHDTPIQWEGPGSHGREANPRSVDSINDPKKTPDPERHD